MLQQPLEVVPDDPYVELRSSAVIAQGDIKRFYQSSQWEGAGGHEVGKVVGDVDQWVFARILVPEGYRLRSRHERADIGDLCWQSDVGQWAPYSLPGAALIADLKRAAKQNGYRVYYATPIESVEPEVTRKLELQGQRIDLIEGHRWMDVGELTRQGDRYRMAEDDDWRTVDLGRAGFPVPEKSEGNGFVSYCRVISPLHKFWHISSAGSDEHGRGTMMEPWKTVEHARSRIEKGAKQLGTAIHGSVIDESGAGVLHFDMDAPDIVTSPQNQPVQARSTLQSDGTIAPNTGRVYLPKDKRLRPTHWSRQNISRFMKRLNSKFPLYRCTFIGDRLKGTDMVCARVDSRWQWGFAASLFPDGIGDLVDNCPWIVARAHAPEPEMSELAKDIALIEYRINELVAIFADMKERHRGK